MTLTRAAGFTLIEVLFAILIVGVGVIGVVSLFAHGVAITANSKNTTNAAIAAQSLASRIVSESVAAAPATPPLPPTHPFLDRISAGRTWIQDDSNTPVPVLVDAANPDNDLWWSCRASTNQMNPAAYADKSQDNTALPYSTGSYQLAIFVYRNYQPNKAPISVYSTVVTAGY